MGWQDAPLVEDGDETELPQWASAPEVRAPGHGPIGRRPAPDPLAKYEGMSAFDKLKNDLGIVGDSFGDLRDAFNRASVRAWTGGIAIPADMWQTAENLIKNRDDWSWSEAFDNPFNPTPHPGWEPLPSQRLEELMDKYVAPPPETALGRLSELGGSALLAHRIPSLYTPPKVPSAPNPKLPSPGPDEIIRLGKQHKVRVFYDDITKNPLIKKVGIFAESIPGPLGTSVGRSAQNEDALDAARRVVAQQKPATGDDVTALMQSAMQRKLKVLQDQKRDLYRIAGKELDPYGKVDTPLFDKAYKTAKKTLKSLPIASNRQRLRALKELYKEGGEHKFSVTSKLSDELGGMIDDYYTGANTTIGSEGVQHLQSMKKALDQDIAVFANNAKKVGRRGQHAYKVADEFYRTNIVPYTAQGFSGLVRSSEPEKIWDYVTAKGGVPSRVSRMYNALDPEGQQAVRYGLVKTAFDHALDKKGTIFSPARFSSYLENHDAVIKKFFKGSDRDEINGFKNLMSHVERSGQFMENPANGQRVLLPALVGSGLYSLKIPMMGVATGVGARVLFQTERGRDLLRAMGRAAPESADYKKAVSDTIRFLATTAELDRQSSAPTSLDFNDVIESAVGPGPADRQ